MGSDEHCVFARIHWMPIAWQSRHGDHERFSMGILRLMPSKLRQLFCYSNRTGSAAVILLQVKCGLPLAEHV